MAVFYPVFFALAFVMDEASSNGVALGAAPRALLAAVLISVTAIAVGIVATRSRGRGPVLGLAVLFALAAGDGPFPLLLAAGALAVALYDMQRSRRGQPLPWTDINRGMTVLGASLLVLVTLPLLRSADLPHEWRRPEIAATPSQKPDIYVVLLDGFGRPDVLASQYGHDTRPFVQKLSEQGLEVASGSRSNYPTTGLSLTSMLNATPLSQLGYPDDGPHDPAVIHPSLERNLAFDIVRDAGYETVAFSSGYELVSLRTADRFIDTGEPNELEIDLIGETLLEPAIDAYAGDLKSDAIRARAESMVSAVTGLAAQQSDRPRFVFVHFPMPHPPYVVDAKCRAIDGGEPIFVATAGGGFHKPAEREREEVALTAGQVECTERLATRMVDGILDGAGPGAVVIVMSDHGPESKLDWFNLQPGPMKDRLRNFFAARTPGQPHLFPDDITLVNVIPTLFRAYLGVDLPIQPNTSYFAIPGAGLTPVPVD